MHISRKAISILRISPSNISNNIQKYTKTCNVQNVSNRFNLWPFLDYIIFVYRSLHNIKWPMASRFLFSAFPFYQVHNIYPFGGPFSSCIPIFQHNLHFIMVATSVIFHFDTNFPLWLTLVKLSNVTYK